MVCLVRKVGRQADGMQSISIWLRLNKALTERLRDRFEMSIGEGG